MTWFAFASGLGLYLLLCLTATLTGFGLVRLLRLRTDARAEAVLAPVAAFLFWSLVLGVTGGLRLPVRSVAPWLWAASVLAAVHGLPRAWSVLRAAGLPVLACAALPVLIMARTFAGGLTQYAGTVAGDGSVYVLAGRYFWEHPRGAAPG